MEEVLSEPLADYGYRRMSFELNLLGWRINHKKVYRLMKSAHLLQPQPEARQRDYVRCRVVCPCPEQPLRLLEVDIKQVWLSGLRRYGYTLKILDVFTHPYTPQENGHIESFHSILAQGLRGQDFESLPDLEGYLEHFYHFYNWQWEKTRKVRFSLKGTRYQITKASPADNGSPQAVPSQQQSSAVLPIIL